MILVDNIETYTTRLRYKEWCHMHSDTSEDELHDFASRLGLKREWFQSKPYAHYDITPSKRQLAVKLGAQEVTPREGLARNFDYRKRKGLP